MTGQVVGVQGPYGRFEFEPKDASQIWVAGGVGVTPFLARLQSLTASTVSNPVDFYLCVRDDQTDVVTTVRNLCAQVGVNLHVIVSGKDKPLSGAQIRQEIPDWQTRHVWFCGPSGLGQAVRDELKAHGLASKQFHQELFDMR